MWKISMKETYVACYRCGHVHLECSRAEAQKGVDNLNDFLEKASPELHEYFGEELDSIHVRERCAECHNSYKLFREAEHFEIPSTSYIPTVINRFQ
jgi:hypothetical protein